MACIVIILKNRKHVLTTKKQKTKNKFLFLKIESILFFDNIF